MRNYFTKGLALVLTLAMVLSLTPMTLVSAAPTDIQFKIDTVTVEKGTTDVITVPVKVSKMPSGFQLGSTGWEFLFDSTKLNFQTSTDYTAFSGPLIKNPTADLIMGMTENIDGTNGKFRWGFATTNNYITPADVAADATLLNLKFKLPEGLPAGTYPITVQSYGNITNGTAEYVSQDDIDAALNTYMVPGAIVVTEPVQPADFIIAAGEVEGNVGDATIDVPLNITKMYADKNIGAISVEVNYDTTKFTFDKTVD
ncbi:MAG: cohesin domain-containing protein, partial [Eubacteriales bacterium]|nr:cohesin domain-containing protein [Eubacteriales bacterium]